VKPLPAADLDHVLEHTKELWARARGSRIFLCGATGFFGVWLLESLAHCNRKMGVGISAVVLSRDPGRFCTRFPHIAHAAGMQFLEGDIRNFAPPSGEFDYVLHAATPTAKASSLDAEDLLSSIFDGTRRVLAFAKASGAKKLLFVSSGAVYGRQPPEIEQVPESYPGGPDWVNPDAVYAEGKRIAEQLCAIAAQSWRIRVAIARCFAFVGPHLPLDQHFAIGNFIANALAGEPIHIRGDGTPLRSYLYASDLAIWLWTMLLSDPVDGSNPAIVNVGSGDGISIREVAQQVAQAIQPELEIQIAQRAPSSHPPSRYVPNVAQAERLYGLRQTVSLQEAIRRTAGWHRSI
jgi:dTDP-glucose 4,6-dehydratase